MKGNDVWKVAVVLALVEVLNASKIRMRPQQSSQSVHGTQLPQAETTQSRPGLTRCLRTSWNARSSLTSGAEGIRRGDLTQPAAAPWAGN